MMLRTAFTTMVVALTLLLAGTAFAGGSRDSVSLSFGYYGPGPVLSFNLGGSTELSVGVPGLGFWYYDAPPPPPARRHSYYYHRPHYRPNYRPHHGPHPGPYVYNYYHGHDGRDRHRR